MLKEEPHSYSASAATERQPELHACLQKNKHEVIGLDDDSSTNYSQEFAGTLPTPLTDLSASQHKTGYPQHIT